MAYEIMYYILSWMIYFFHLVGLYFPPSCRGIYFKKWQGSAHKCLKCKDILQYFSGVVGVDVMKQEYALMPHRILRYSTPKKALSIVLLICVSPCPLLSHPAPCCLTLPHAVSPCPRKCPTLPRGVPNCPQMCCFTKTTI